MECQLPLGWLSAKDDYYKSDEIRYIWFVCPVHGNHLDRIPVSPTGSITVTHIAHNGFETTVAHSYITENGICRIFPRINKKNTECGYSGFFSFKLVESFDELKNCLLRTHDNTTA